MLEINIKKFKFGLYIICVKYSPDRPCKFWKISEIVFFFQSALKRYNFLVQRQEFNAIFIFMLTMFNNIMRVEFKLDVVIPSLKHTETAIYVLKKNILRSGLKNPELGHNSGKLAVWQYICKPNTAD